jgi:hypothetical protein
MNHASSNRGLTKVRSAAFHGVFYGRGYSGISQNVAFCANRYHCYINDILSGATHSAVTDSMQHYSNQLLMI